MAKPRVLAASDAAELIPDGAIVTVSSSSALGCPDAVLAAIGTRFDTHGHPRNLTTLHPIWNMISDDAIPCYNVPSGILFDLHREAAAKRPGVLTKVGMDTFVDPIHEGCAM